MSKPNKNNEAFYHTITNAIIELLEKVNLEDYQPPFASLAAQGLPINPFTKNQYQGVNIPCLWYYQQKKRFNSNHWATFKQWKVKGASVRKGEKGSTICFYKTLLLDEENEHRGHITNRVPMMKLYTVFNAQQVDGYEHLENPPHNERDLVERIGLADEFCANTNADIRHINSGSAYYSISGDFICLPETTSFLETKYSTATENYYSTLLHELVHFTGHKSRLDRLDNKDLSKRHAYAFEELIAELGAAMLCAKLNITQHPREDHAQYIKGWLQALKNDNRFVFKASAHAAKAVDFLNNLQPQ